MKHGFVKTAAVTVKEVVADPKENAVRILEKIKEAGNEGAKLIVLPELCISSYSCGDLFFQETLQKESVNALHFLAEETKDIDALIFVGLPLMVEGCLYNVAAALNRGRILGVVPKRYIPNYKEFYEARYFAQGSGKPFSVDVGVDYEVLMGTNLLFVCEGMPKLVVAAEICEDIWAPKPPSVEHALSGATLIVNLSASDETTGKDVYRRELVTGQSARLICGYVYASAGDGESTQDVVYSGHNLIAENGILLKESKRFTNETIYAEIDVNRLAAERAKMNTFICKRGEDYCTLPFSLEVTETELTRGIDPAPFVPGNQQEREKRCEEILAIQSMGLKKRLEHTGAAGAVIGISGGLDSTLALLVTVRAFDLLHLPRRKITAVTMPGFGTTGRTYENALKLIKHLGATLVEVDIKEAVRVHFRDIGQDESVHDITYENGQARERTQILMDIANKKGGMVIGTGDMSELALGWATYNGDHMSMYGVNASVPKTLVRHLVQYYADTCVKAENEGALALREVLLDVLNTPVSPELLPPKDGEIAQKTEDIVGPYELHDFYLYYVMRFGFSPSKIYRLAKIAFWGIYDSAVIKKWLTTFYHRFFSQQFKRSCLPDGPKVGSVAVSPRGDLRMPSDAVARIWLEELKELEE